MPTAADRAEAPTAIQTKLAAIFVSLELSRSVWLITFLSPGFGQKMSKHSVPAGDVSALLTRFAELKQKALARTGRSFPIVSIQEAGLDGLRHAQALRGRVGVFSELSAHSRASGNPAAIRSESQAPGSPRARGRAEMDADLSHSKETLMAPALTPESWAQIRYDYEHTSRPIADICAEHGISDGTLRDRMRRWNWTRRRSAIPREGPPALLIVDEAIAPSGTAATMAEPATHPPSRHASGTAPQVAALPSAEGNAAPLVPALQEAVTTVLPAIQRTLTRLAEGRYFPDDAAKTARALEALTRTLRELSILLSRQPRRQ